MTRTLTGLPVKSVIALLLRTYLLWRRFSFSVHKYHRIQRVHKELGEDCAASMLYSHSQLFRAFRRIVCCCLSEIAPHHEVGLSLSVLPTFPRSFPAICLFANHSTIVCTRTLFSIHCITKAKGLIICHNDGLARGKYNTQSPEGCKPASYYSNALKGLSRPVSQNRRISFNNGLLLSERTEKTFPGD